MINGFFPFDLDISLGVVSQPETVSGLAIQSKITWIDIVAEGSNLNVMADVDYRTRMGKAVFVPGLEVEFTQLFTEETSLNIAPGIEFDELIPYSVIGVKLVLH